MKTLKIIKSQNDKYVSFLQGERNIACLDLNKLKTFLNDNSKDIEDFINEVQTNG